MRYRKLRIAWSVVCGIACLLLIVLWVRSYWWYDMVQIKTSWRLLQIHSSCGHAGLCQFNFGRNPSTSAQMAKEDIDDIYSGCGGRHAIRPAGDLKLPFGSNVSTITMPQWPAIVFAAACTAFPLVHWSNRFSLRTLLIATTLVAVVLGLIIAVLRLPAG
jgi:hypothetical protein